MRLALSLIGVVVVAVAVVVVSLAPSPVGATYVFRAVWRRLSGRES